MNILLLYVYTWMFQTFLTSESSIQASYSAYSLYYGALQRSGGFPEKFVKFLSHRAVNEPRLYIYLKKANLNGRWGRGGKIFPRVLYIFFFWGGFLNLGKWTNVQKQKYQKGWKTCPVMSNFLILNNLYTVHTPELYNRLINILMKFMEKPVILWFTIFEDYRRKF